MAKTQFIDFKAKHAATPMEQVTEHCSNLTEPDRAWRPVAETNAETMRIGEDNQKAQAGRGTPSNLSFSECARGDRALHERVGSRELVTARQDPKFAQWEIELPQCGLFHQMIENRLARRRFRAAARNPLVLEAAKVFVIRERIGGWAIKFLTAGMLYFSPLEVRHSVDNFVRSPEGRRYLQNVPLELFSEETMLIHPSAGTIMGRPELPPDLQLLRKEFKQLLQQNRAGLIPRDQKLFDLLQANAPYSDERGEALRQFSREQGISTDPGSVHRWIKKLQKKLLEDVRLKEILSDYFRNRATQATAAIQGIAPWSRRSAENAA